MADDGRLLAGLVAIGRSVAGDACRDVEPEVLSDRVDGVIVRVGGVVVKAHRAGTDLAELLARLRVAASAPLDGILLPPLAGVGSQEGRARWQVGGAGPREDGAGSGSTVGPLLVEVGGRLVTAWPAGEPVNPDDPDAAPWEQAARLLARLHDPGLVAVAGPSLPAAGGPARLARAMARLGAGGGPAGAEVRRAFAGLPPWARGATQPAGERCSPPGPPGRGGRAIALTHGDWHLGQVVWVPAVAVTAAPGDSMTGRSGTGRSEPRVAGDARGWRLVDVDDLGIGDPAWDLGRPAAWYAAGLLPSAVWERFLSAYRASGGSALPPDGDPWAVLDVPARALVVQAAALAVAAAGRDGRPLDEVETALADACRRIVQVGGTP